MSPAPVEPDDLFKGLPRRLQIGAYTFRVSVVDQDHEKLAGNEGMTHFDEFRIYLHPKLGQRALEVVQHEITHCVNWVYGIDDDSTEETFTTQHSKGLTELWMRNPRLWNWFAKTLRQARKDSAKD